MLPSASRQEPLPPEPHLWDLDQGPPTSRTVRSKRPSFELPRLQDSVAAAAADRYDS